MKLRASHFTFVKICLALIHGIHQIYILRFSLQSFVSLDLYMGSQNVIFFNVKIPDFLESRESCY